MMDLPGHKPILKGSTYVCSDCGRFLLDITTGAKLKNLTDVDPVKLAAVIARHGSDPDLAERLVKEDPRTVVSSFKLADKMNDFLKNPKARPDLQTPEAQQFLTKLQNKYWNSKTDELMPWITREWKKGRIREHPSGVPGLQFQGHPDYEYDDENGVPTNWHNISEAGLDHWGDWNQSDHPSRQGQDIMKMGTPDMHQTINGWDQDMREKAQGAAAKRGEIVHSFPDGWTVQNLNHKAVLEDEGEAMGHCVGGYWPGVQNGSTSIYSLRDHQNVPHATWEVKPKWEHPDDPEFEPITNHERNRLKSNGDRSAYDLTPTDRKGEMVQIQGKGNSTPIPRHQERIKDYFEKAMPDPKDRPHWQDQTRYYVDEMLPNDPGANFAFYHEGNYGLEEPDKDNDWESVIPEAALHLEDPTMPRKLAWAAHKEGEIPQMKKALQEWHDSERANHYVDWHSDNYNLENKLQHQYEVRNPPPNYDDPESPYEAWADQMKKHTAPELEAMKQESWKNSPYRLFTHNVEKHLNQVENGQQAANSYEEPESIAIQPTSSAHKPAHANYATGKPCYCTFLAGEPAWHEAAFADNGDPKLCPTCGDELVHAKCKRCNWMDGPSNAMGDNQPLTDVTKELKPAIQS